MKSFLLLFSILVYIQQFAIVSTAKEAPKSLQIGVKKEGDCSKKAGLKQSVSVHYTGRLYSDNSIFDSSVERGDPFTFTLGVGQVIKGWDQGIVGMCLGEKRKLTIPSDLAYGDRGAPPTIPAGATLIFDVELLGLDGDFSDGAAHGEL